MKLSDIQEAERLLDILDLSEQRKTYTGFAARQIREDALLTQLDVAEYLNVTPATISRWESETRWPVADQEKKWFELLNQLEVAA